MAEAGKKLTSEQLKALDEASAIMREAAAKAVEKLRSAQFPTRPRRMKAFD